MAAGRLLCRTARDCRHGWRDDHQGESLGNEHAHGVRDGRSALVANGDKEVVKPGASECGGGVLGSVRAVVAKSDRRGRSADYRPRIRQARFADDIGP